jgi:hypothetical protein
MDNEEKEQKGEDEELEFVEIFDFLDERTVFDEVNEIIRIRGSVRGTLAF